MGFIEVVEWRTGRTTRRTHRDTRVDVIVVAKEEGDCEGWLREQSSQRAVRRQGRVRNSRRSYVMNLGWSGLVEW